MTSKVKYEVIYNRNGKLDRNNKATVVIECYQDRVRRYKSTGVRIAENEWDKKQKEVKKRPDINRLIRKRIDELEQFELTFSAKFGRPFRLADFDLMYHDAPSEEVLVTFTDFALEHIEIDRAKNDFKDVTMKRYKRVIGLLAEALGVKTVKFSDLTFTNIESFDNFLIVDQDQDRNTAYKHHQVIAKYLIRAVKKGVFKLQDNPYNDFKNKQKPTETVVLSPSEITKIEELTFNSENQHLEFYRDAFLLAYYTLLRIGDVTELRNRNIIETDEGLVLDMSAQKTKKINRQKLFAMHPTRNNAPSKPERLLRKYWRTDNQPFFKRSHPNMNEYLKDVIRLAGIEKDVTFHTSRHSGITTLVAMGVEVPMVQKLAQHKSIVTTMRYVHIAQQDVYQSLSRAFSQHGKHSEAQV